MLLFTKQLQLGKKAKQFYFEVFIPRLYSGMGLSWWYDAQEMDGFFFPGSAACAESDVDIPWQQSAFGNYLEQASRVGEPQPCGPRKDRFGLWRGNTTCSVVIRYQGNAQVKWQASWQALEGQAEPASWRDCQDLGGVPPATRQGSVSSMICLNCVLEI